MWTQKRSFGIKVKLLRRECWSWSLHIWYQSFQDSKPKSFDWYWEQINANYKLPGSYLCWTTTSQTNNVYRWFYTLTLHIEIWHGQQRKICVPPRSQGSLLNKMRGIYSVLLIDVAWFCASACCSLEHTRWGQNWQIRGSCMRVYVCK